MKLEKCEQHLNRTKLKRHLETTHPNNKNVEYFKRKRNEL